LREQLQLTAEHHEAPTHVANADAVVTTKVSYGLEVWRQSARKPHQLNIALAFTFQATARLNPVPVPTFFFE
jgi:cytochrome c biogenesis protein ResB